MLNLRHFLRLMCVWTLLLIPAIVSAHSPVHPETRVGAFEVAAEACVRLSVLAISSGHKEKLDASTAEAVGYPHATKGAAGFGRLFAGGRTAKASELSADALRQGLTAQKAAGGPLKFVDGNGVVRLTIKQGSSRAPGSNFAHAEFRNAAGQRVDAFGNAVTRKSPGNHTPIDFDLLP